MSTDALKLMLRAIILTVLVVASTFEVRAGFLYALNQQIGAPNQIYGYSINEGTGGLTLLSGFPISSGGNGIASTGAGQMTIDRANQRLYAVNDGSNTVTAFSINPDTGQLTPMPFSPIALPAGTWFGVTVHPTGSPLVVSDGDSTPFVASFVITETSATAASGSPYPTGTAGIVSSTFSRDGNFFYTGGGGGGNTFAKFSVNVSSGFLTAIPLPFNSGAPSPNAFATDSKGRLFVTHATNATLRAFTTSYGLPAGVTGNPFASGLLLAGGGAMHPNERFYYVADVSLGRVGSFQISGEGAATTLAAVPGSPVNSGGTETNAIALNGSGGFLFATNNTTRNISTYTVNAGSGALTFNNVQPTNTLGTNGNITGIATLPTVFTVKNTNDSGADSLRQLISLVGTLHSGAMIVFDRTFFSVPRTILQGAGQIPINTHLNIIGPGAHLLTIRSTAAASTTSRVFNIGPAVNVTLSGMTIAGGNLTGASSAGAGVSSESFSSILMIRDCLITGNRSAFGAGIKNNSVLNVVNSTVSGNRAFGAATGGGGIDNSGTLFLTTSTVSGNSKTGGGTSGGGVWNQGSATITNSTITMNACDSGAGGVTTAAVGSATVRATIIAGNVNNTVIPDVHGPFTSPTGIGFNLIGNVGTATGFPQIGDQTGTGAEPLDPRLVKVLAYKGGTVPVHMPLLHSRATDRGVSNFTTDQRGSIRPFDIPEIGTIGDGSDIGAVERRAQESIFTAPFDFDGDGKTDIGTFRPLGNAEWWINRSSDGSTFAAQFGSGSFPIVPADYTGDGKADIAIWRPANGHWFVLRSEDFSFFSFPFGQDNDIPAPADFDGDAKADAAVFRPSSATWFISNSGGGTTIQQFGANGDRPVPADYDGDGRADIAIYRPNVGQWWINRSTAGLFAVTFGVSSDKQVQGDYTGDTRADVAFWRPSTGEWFVLRSEDFSFFSFPFGASGDVPAPGDYDGDGRHDATVFRPSNATWFSQRTNAGILIQPFGVASDRPIPNAFVP